MKNCYKPLQTLVFNFNKGEKKLYVKSTTSVYLDSNESLVLQNVPALGSAAIIQYQVSTEGTPGTVYTEKILLMDLAEFAYTEETLSGKLKDLIDNDLQLKKIRFYVVTVSVNKQIATDLEIEDNTTSTISSDDTIEIEE